MFFFIGGIQPRTIDLDQQPVLCPSCGLNQARYKRVDHYISIFFIPLIRIKKGVPFLICDRCGSQAFGSGTGSYNPPFRSQAGLCKYCGSQLDQDFRYCPFCGKEL
jgi:hypothetical protein